MAQRRGKGRSRGIATAALPWALGVILGLGSGCAGLEPGAPRAPSELRRAAAPADRSAEFDFLVGRGLELDGRMDEALEIYRRALSKDPDSTYLLRKVAELSARRNDIDAALGYAERAHSLDRDDVGVRLFLGTLYRLKQERERAELVLRGESGDPVSADAALLLYSVVADEGRFEEAEQLTRWLIEAEPEALRGYFALADVLEKKGEPEAAEAALREALEHHPNELALYAAIARGRRDRNDRLGEIEIYRQILRRDPRHHATLLALSDALLALERNDEAVAILERVEVHHPEDVRSVLRLGFLEFERGNLMAAARRFERALASHAEQHEIRYFLGVVRRRLGERDGAMEAFSRIPPSHERYSEARTQLAALYERRGDYERAIAEVERARAQEPARPLDLYLASLRSKSGDFPGALTFLEELLEESPDDPELLYNIGVIYGEARRIDEALHYMERTLELDPNHAGALNYVGYTWAERGTNLTLAEEYVTRALELRPDDGYITDSLGWIYYMRARPLLETGDREDGLALLDEALTQLERAAELTGGDPVISEHLGDVYLLRGEKERALEMYEDALELEPRASEQPKLREKYERLLRELGGR